MAIKQLRLLSVNLLSSQNVYLTRRQFLLSALRYIKIITKNNKFVVFGDSKSALRALLSRWDHPTVQTIMRFLVFLHTVHKTVIFCWLPISGNERADSAAKATQQKDVSNCLISYTDTYQYISQYVRDMLGNSYLTHSYLLKGGLPPEYVTCKCRLTISHILVDCIEYDFFQIDFV